MTTTCQRCGIPARGRKGSEDARILRAAEHGVCLECGVVEFIRGLSSLYGPDVFSGLPEGLRFPHMQEQFARLMAVGRSDANPADINWERVIAVWDVTPRAPGILF